MSYWVRPLLVLYLRGKKYEDPIDGKTFRKFLPYGYGSPRANVLSPSTLSLERHRLLWLYLTRETDFFSKPLKVLHVAPEQAFYKRFKKQKNLTYITTDLYSPLADVKADLCALPFEDDSFEVHTDLLDHTIFCLGYRVVEKNRIGELDANALKEAGLPFGPLFGKIKKGEIVQYEGKTFDPKDYIGADKAGKIVTILGDTRKSNVAVRLAYGADLLVHEATYEANESKMARAHGHSTTKQAADVAKEAGVNRLLLTHISARYVGPLVGQLVREAQTVHSNTFVVKDFYEEKIG